MEAAVATAERRWLPQRAAHGPSWPRRPMGSASAVPVGAHQEPSSSAVAAALVGSARASATRTATTAGRGIVVGRLVAPAQAPATTPAAARLPAASPAAGAAAPKGSPAAALSPSCRVPVLRASRGGFPVAMGGSRPDQAARRPEERAARLRSPGVAERGPTTEMQSSRHAEHSAAPQFPAEPATSTAQERSTETAEPTGVDSARLPGSRPAHSRARPSAPPDTTQMQVADPAAGRRPAAEGRPDQSAASKPSYLRDLQATHSGEPQRRSLPPVTVST